MIESLKCDIWRFYNNAGIVIPTNIGWTRDGLNVMGRGLAKQASSMIPHLAKFYGGYCQDYGADTDVVECPGEPRGIILFPVKPLDVAHPNMSWKQDARLDLIERSARQLQSMMKLRRITAVPLVGCGNGRLKEEDVLPILRTYLDDSFILVRPE